MRLRITCMECFKQDGSPPDLAIPVELRGDGLYTVTCPKGHLSVTSIQEQKFEVLFDLAAMALVDGYPREAISSTAAALERFLEYCVRVISWKHGVNTDAFDECWKLVSRQSERQLGAFLFLYLLEYEKPVSPWVYDERPESGSATETWARFRNKVVHEGYIPSREEAVAYCGLVYRWIYQIIADLKTSCDKSMKRETFEHLRRIGDLTDIARSTMTIPTLISLNRAGMSAGNFADELLTLERYRLWLYLSD